MEKTRVTISHYENKDEEALFNLLEQEGDEWKDYWCGSGQMKYKRALGTSVTYLIFEGDELCGYARCRDDDGYGIYIYDLLVNQKHRGKEYGRLLMEHAYQEFPDTPVYVMSDVDPYYKKLGYEKEGTIFAVATR